MQIIRNIIAFLRRNQPYSGIIIGAFLVILVIALNNSGNGESEEPETAVRAVETIAVGDYRSGAVSLAYPTVDGSAFVIRSEHTGSIRRAVETGTAVEAGAVIAEFDNAAARAALTQAQGSYEAAQAAAARSDLGVNDARAALTAAKQAAVNADRSALASWHTVLYNTVDQLFANPQLNQPGVRISSAGQASQLSSERYAMIQVLNDWQAEVASLSDGSDTSALTAALDRAISRTDRLSSMVEVFITLLARQNPDGYFSEADIARLQSEFAASRATLNGNRAGLENAKTALVRTEEGLRSAEVGGTGGRVSAADAALRQALGAYQAVRVSYDKTIVRAPFAGRITNMNVAVGDIVNFGADVATIVPREGEETEMSFLLPLSAVKYAPDGALVFMVNAEGVLESKAVEAGLVTASYIKVTGLSGDEQIVADVRGLKAGEQVVTK